MIVSDLETLPCPLREQAGAEGMDNIGSHQLDAHWSLAYACLQPPEP
jgi:hypothetical protein